MMTIVTVQELRVATEALFSHLERSGVTSIMLSEDYYWDVPAVNRYDQYQEPSQHTIGQLSDDLTELKRMLSGDQPIVGYALVWLAAILRRVGETVKC
jgi:hypothetical protein